MTYGYNGRILHLDLSHHTWWIEEPSDAFYRKYAGGSAMALYYLLKEMQPHTDPLSSDNLLVFSVGPVAGAPISGQSRLMVNAKSPLTGVIGDSQSGGFFPAELKFAGFDALVIRGKSPDPVYLWIKDGQVEIRDARPWWGKITGDVEAGIREELQDNKVQIAQVGPAGEKLVRFAAIINMCTRANGRTGMGAVMASKNLKAIAVRGSQGGNSLRLWDRAAIIRLARLGVKGIPDNPDTAGLAKYGSPGVVSYQNMIGSLPAFNYTSGVFDGWEKISGETMYETILEGARESKQNMRGRDTCYACAVRCKRVVNSEYDGRKVEPRYGGPEYETITTLGSYCGVDDLPAIALANQLCNQYGADTISAGATIAFAMECFERGILTRRDTDGLDLNFGNAEAMVTLTEQMLTRSTPLGNLLAEGSAIAAEKIGHGAEELLITVKGQELPGHMPQAKRSLALIYAVNPFGADHQSSEHDPLYEEGSTGELYLQHFSELGLYEPTPPRSLGPEKIRYALKTQHFYSATDAFGLCQYVFAPGWCIFDPNQTVELIRAVTGWNYSLYEFMQVGELRVNLMRAFNAREGIGRREDRLPARLFQPLKGGATDGVKLDEAEIEAAKDLYYAMSGWDMATGVPTRAKLAQLGVDWVGDLISMTGRTA